MDSKFPPLSAVDGKFTDSDLPAGSTTWRLANAQRRLRQMEEMGVDATASRHEFDNMVFGFGFDKVAMENILPPCVMELVAANDDVRFATGPGKFTPGFNGEVVLYNNTQYNATELQRLGGSALFGPRPSVAMIDTPAAPGVGSRYVDDFESVTGPQVGKPERAGNVQTAQTRFRALRYLPDVGPSDSVLGAAALVFMGLGHLAEDTAARIDEGDLDLDLRALERWKEAKFRFYAAEEVKMATLEEERKLRVKWEATRRLEALIPEGEITNKQIQDMMELMENDSHPPRPEPTLYYDSATDSAQAGLPTPAPLQFVYSANWAESMYNIVVGDKVVDTVLLRGAFAVDVTETAQHVFHYLRTLDSSDQIREKATQLKTLSAAFQRLRRAVQEFHHVIDSGRSHTDAVAVFCRLTGLKQSEIHLWKNFNRTMLYLVPGLDPGLHDILADKRGFCYSPFGLNKVPTALPLVDEKTGMCRWQKSKTLPWEWIHVGHHGLRFILRDLFMVQDYTLSDVIFPVSLFSGVYHVSDCSCDKAAKKICTTAETFITEIHNHPYAYHLVDVLVREWRLRHRMPKDFHDPTSGLTREASWNIAKAHLIPDVNMPFVLNVDTEFDDLMTVQQFTEVAACRVEMAIPVVVQAKVKDWDEFAARVRRWVSRKHAGTVNFVIVHDALGPSHVKHCLGAVLALNKGLKLLESD